MTVLTIAANTNFTGQTLTNIDGLTFTGEATAQFSSSQFGPGLILDTVAVTADGNANVIIVVLAATGTFSAAGWTFSGWTPGPDNIQLGGTNGNDVFIGSSVNDLLKGEAGNDTLSGGAGNDTLFGDAGNDFMTGGIGDDRYFVDSALDIINEKIGEGNDTVQTSLASYVLVNEVEYLQGMGTSQTLKGNRLDNVIEGNSGNDTLDGGTGFDTLAGGAGDDVYIVDAVWDIVTEQFNQGTDTVIAISQSFTLGANLENLTGSSGYLSFSLKGNATANIITGGYLNDTLTGGAGNDTLNGGIGNDTASFHSDATNGGSLGVYVNLAAGVAVDGFGAVDSLNSIEAVYGTNSIYNGLPAWSDFLIGSIAHETFHGFGGNDYIDMGSGHNYAEGGSGNDHIIGGEGTDTVSYYWDFSSGGTSGVYVSLLSNVAIDGFGHVDTLTSIEVINGTDSTHSGLPAWSDFLIGSGAVETINGYGGNDYLDMGGGNDTGSGGDGDNYLFGGDGDDSLHGGSGIDYITGDAGADTILGGADADYLFGGTGGDVIYGQTGSDFIIAGAGSDYLVGGPDQDYFYNVSHADYVANDFDVFGDLSAEDYIFMPLALQGVTGFIDYQGGAIIYASVAGGNWYGFVSGQSAAFAQAHVIFG